MMNRHLTAAVVLSLSAGSAIASDQGSATGYALADGGRTLAVMTDLATPTEIATVALAEPLAAIAYRPVTGDLLGYSNGAIYSIDASTGALTDLGATYEDEAGVIADAMVGFDFNNKIDAVRAVSSAGDNLVYFPVGFGGGDPKANSVRRFTSLAYEEGDVNVGATPIIYANAYTNAIDDKTAGDTFQYALDAGADTLVSLANNAGSLKTIGALSVDGVAVDVTPMGGFDILSPEEGQNHAFAILQLAGQDTAGLYAIDLETAAATLIADLGAGGFSGFAVSTAK